MVTLRILTVVTQCWYKNPAKIKLAGFSLLLKFASSPYEIRTRITTVKGWCPNP